MILFLGISIAVILNLVVVSVGKTLSQPFISPVCFSTHPSDKQFDVDGHRLLLLSRCWCLSPLAPFLLPLLSSFDSEYIVSTMARPEEKANAMMNKWVAMRDAGNAPTTVHSQKRPYLASQCEHVNDAEFYRRQIIREISELISKIQNPGLGEHAIRDMNDDINKKFREKYNWNKRIKELGGPDYIEIERKQQMESGGDWQEAILGSGGYRYFGAAKDLPGVQELFAKAAAARDKKRRKYDWKRLTPDYYGWRDEEDGVLLRAEAEATRRKRREIIESRGAPLRDEEEDNDDDEFDVDGGAAWSVPTEEALEAVILEHKKKALLARLG